MVKLGPQFSYLGNALQGTMCSDLTGPATKTVTGTLPPRFFKTKLPNNRKPDLWYLSTLHLSQIPLFKKVG